MSDNDAHMASAVDAVSVPAVDSAMPDAHVPTATPMSVDTPAASTTPVAAAEPAAVAAAASAAAVLNSTTVQQQLDALALLTGAPPPPANLRMSEWHDAAPTVTPTTGGTTTAPSSGSGASATATTAPSVHSAPGTANNSIIMPPPPPPSSHSANNTLGNISVISSATTSRGSRDASPAVSPRNSTSAAAAAMRVRGQQKAEHDRRAAKHQAAKQRKATATSRARTALPVGSAAGGGSVAAAVAAVAAAAAAATAPGAGSANVTSSATPRGPLAASLAGGSDMDCSISLDTSFAGAHLAAAASNSNKLQPPHDKDSTLNLSHISQISMAGDSPTKKRSKSTRAGGAGARTTTIAAAVAAVSGSMQPPSPVMTRASSTTRAGRPQTAASSSLSSAVPLARKDSADSKRPGTAAPAAIPAGVAPVMSGRVSRLASGLTSARGSVTISTNTGGAALAGSGSAPATPTKGGSSAASTPTKPPPPPVMLGNGTSTTPSKRAKKQNVDDNTDGGFAMPTARPPSRTTTPAPPLATTPLDDTMTFESPPTSAGPINAPAAAVASSASSSHGCAPLVTAHGGVLAASSAPSPVNSGDNIRVVVRMRPYNNEELAKDRESEKSNGVAAMSDVPAAAAASAPSDPAAPTPAVAVDGSTVVLNNARGMAGNKHTYSYDHVFGADATQSDVFEHVGKPIAACCAAGYNATIFAYGQTGAGKTFTMLGTPSIEAQHGLIPRVLAHLFELTSSDASGKRWEYACSFLQIYNETLSDLLAEQLSSRPTTSAGSSSSSSSNSGNGGDGSSGELVIRQEKAGGIRVDGLSMHRVQTVRDATALLDTGLARRSTASTSMNEYSSRSHAVFTLYCTCTSIDALTGASTCLTSRLHLVDLAGSESQKTAQTAGARLKEASGINKSLSQLGNVIMALADGNRPHVPYRNSKLTWLLKDSLGGNSKTCLIANISPAAACAAETLSTLQFAQRAKIIKNKAVVNKAVDGSTQLAELTRKVAALTQENTKLRSDLSAAVANSSPTHSAVDVKSSPAVAGMPNQAELQYVQRIHELESMLHGALLREVNTSNALLSCKSQLDAYHKLCEQQEQSLQALDAEVQALHRAHGIDASGAVPPAAATAPVADAHVAAVPAPATSSNGDAAAASVAPPVPETKTTTAAAPAASHADCMMPDAALAAANNGVHNSSNEDELRALRTLASGLLSDKRQLLHEVSKLTAALSRAVVTQDVYKQDLQLELWKRSQQHAKLRAQLAAPAAAAASVAPAPSASAAAATAAPVAAPLAALAAAPVVAAPAVAPSSNALLPVLRAIDMNVTNAAAANATTAASSALALSPTPLAALCNGTVASDAAPSCGVTSTTTAVGATHAARNANRCSLAAFDCVSPVTAAAAAPAPASDRENIPANSEPGPPAASKPSLDVHRNATPVRAPAVLAMR